MTETVKNFGANQNKTLVVDQGTLVDINFGQEAYTFPNTVVNDNIIIEPSIYEKIKNIKTEDIIRLDDVDLNHILWDNRYYIGDGVLNVPLGITHGVLTVLNDFDDGTKIYQKIEQYDSEFIGYSRKSIDGGIIWSDWQNKNVDMLSGQETIINLNTRLDTLETSGFISEALIDSKITDVENTSSSQLSTAIATEILDRNSAIAAESSTINTRIDNLDLSGDITQTDIDAAIAAESSTINTRIDNLDLSGNLTQADIDSAIAAEVTNRNNAISTAIDNVSVVDHIIVSTNTTAVDNQYLLVDNTSDISITLPLTPEQFTTIYILDIKGIFDTTPLTILRNSETIMGVADDIQLDDANREYKLLYTGTDWRII